MELLANLLFEFVVEAAVALGLRSLCKLPRVAADLHAGCVQTLFSCYRLD